MRKIYLMSFVSLALAMSLAAQPKILYVGIPGKVYDQVPSDSIIIAYLGSMDMDITWVGHDAVEVTYDYSPYDAVVFGESMSSNRLVGFAANDHYPAPAVVLEPLAPRDNVWGWAPDRADWDENFEEDRDELLGWDKLKITDETHFITNVFEKDQIITWSTQDTAYDFLFAIGLNLVHYAPDAVALAENMSPGTTEPCVWALEEGIAIPGDITLPHRMVIIGTQSKSLAVDREDNPDYGKITIGEDFLTIIHRSVRWVLGANVGIGNIQSRSAGITVYPNPASEEVILNFTLDDPGIVSARVINLVGKTVRICEREYRTPGLNEMRIHVDDLPGGIYLYLLEAGSERFTGKFQVVR